MDSRIKMTRDFQSVKGIDRIIENWSKKTGFDECTSPIRLDSEDAAYCFSRDDGNTRVFLNINILDDRVRIETWAMINVQEKQLPGNGSINHLLEMLGQGPL